MAHTPVHDSTSWAMGGMGGDGGWGGGAGGMGGTVFWKTP